MVKLAEGIEHNSRVIWTYQHSLNSRSKIMREKHGIFIGPVRYRPGGLYGPLVYSQDYSLVWIDGNKRWSKVPNWQLQPEGKSDGQV